MASERQFVIENFLGGIHEEVDSSLLKSTEAAKAQNVNIDKGVLKTALGTTKAYTAGSPAAFMSYYNSGSEDLLIVSNGNLLRFQAPNSWVLIGQYLAPDDWTSRYDYVNNNVDGQDVIVFTNGVDPVQIYDSTTGLRALKKLGKTSTPDAVNNVLYGKYLVMHYERLWIADDNNVFASSATRDGFDIEDFTSPTDETEVNMHGFDLSLYDSYGKIIGMTVVFDDVIIFKEKNIHKIFGSDPSNYTKINFSAKGGISDKSIAVHESGAFFADHSGIYYYDGTNVNYISRNIEDTWSKLDIAYLNKAIGFIYNDKYILSVTESPGTANNLVIEYDIKNKNFMIRRGLSIEGSIYYNRKTYVWGAGDDLFEYNAGTTYNGVPMVSYWESGYTDLGVPEATKEIDSLYLTASGLGTMRVTITTEKGAKYKDILLDKDIAVYPITLVHRGRIFKIKIENITGSTFNLKTFKILYELDID